MKMGKIALIRRSFNNEHLKSKAAYKYFFEDFFFRKYTYYLEYVYNNNKNNNIQ